MDNLSLVLSSLRLSGAVFLRGEFSSPWCISAQVETDDCEPFMEVPTHIITYHLITEGGLKVSEDGKDPIVAKVGELIIFPQNDFHLMGSDLSLPPMRASQLVEAVEGSNIGKMSYQGGGDKTKIVCGFLGTNERNNPLICNLPAIMKMDLAGSNFGAWVKESLYYAQNELIAGNISSSTVLQKLAELLLTESIRCYMHNYSDVMQQWLKGLSDPYIGKALALIHSKISHPWTLETLAHEVGLSRTALSDRFAMYIGLPPIRYLNQRRLHIAADCLRDTRKQIGLIAQDVGYEAEASFSRAFKRELGASPLEYRKTHNG